MMWRSPHRVGRSRAAAGYALLVAVSLLVVSSIPASADGRSGSRHEEGSARVFTDRHLRPGHLETIRVTGFAGRGRTEVVFFPTAICGAECAAATRRGAKTNREGAARFSVRMPGSFVDKDGKHVYFRDGERIELEVLWDGPDKSFDVADADPEPTLVRTNGPRRG